MKIVFCLYGQPRSYKYGYECISKFISNNSNHTYDFFFHCWIDDNVVFDHSPWRYLDVNELTINDQKPVRNYLNNFYKPVSYLYETPLDKNKYSDEIQRIKNSEFGTVNSTKKECSNHISENEVLNNAYNTLSQIYSRNKVRNLLKKHIEDTNTHYDMVICTRFDGIDFPIEMDIANIKETNIYASTKYKPRYIIPDNFLITPTKVFLKWFDFYENLNNLMNNKKLKLEVEKYNEKYKFNAEEILLINFLFHGFKFEDISYFNF